MLEAMRRARELGYKLIILVGDLPYYARAGFAVAPLGQIVMPGPVDPARLLYAELAPQALEAYGGPVRGLAPRPLFDEGHSVHDPARHESEGPGDHQRASEQ
jgi:predicted N-acetyltransferase YhbS